MRSSTKYIGFLYLSLLACTFSTPPTDTEASSDAQSAEAIAPDVRELVQSEEEAGPSDAGLLDATVSDGHFSRTHVIMADYPAPQGPTAGDLCRTYRNPGVCKIGGVPLGFEAGAMPAIGTVLTFTGPTANFVPPTGGGGGINQLITDVLAGPGSGSVQATVVAVQHEPFSSSVPPTGATWVFDGTTWNPIILPLNHSAGDVTGTLDVVNGGTGLATLGAGATCLQVNGGGTALVYGPCGGAGGGITALTTSNAITTSTNGDVAALGPGSVTATVTGVQSVPFSNTAPTNHYTWVFNGTMWVPSLIDLTTSVSNILPNANGGLGVNISPGAPNNCVLSNGTVWTSAPCPGGGGGGGGALSISNDAVGSIVGTNISNDIHKITGGGSCGGACVDLSATSFNAAGNFTLFASTGSETFQSRDALTIHSTASDVNVTALNNLNETATNINDNTGTYTLTASSAVSSTSSSTWHAQSAGNMTLGSTSGFLGLSDNNWMQVSTNGNLIWYMMPLVGQPTVGALYSGLVSAGTTNFALAANATATNLNSTSETGLYINGGPIVTATANTVTIDPAVTTYIQAGVTTLAQFQTSQINFNSASVNIANSSTTYFQVIPIGSHGSHLAFPNPSTTSKGATSLSCPVVGCLEINAGGSDFCIPLCAP